MLPFNAELNRLELWVTGASTPRLKVTWGSWFKIFRAEELAKGVNLAAEFLDNPFSVPFQSVEYAVSKQQQYGAPRVHIIGGELGRGRMAQTKDNAWCTESGEDPGIGSCCARRR